MAGHQRGVVWGAAALEVSGSGHCRWFSACTRWARPFKEGCSRKNRPTTHPFLPLLLPLFPPPTASGRHTPTPPPPPPPPPTTSAPAHQHTPPQQQTEPQKGRWE